MLLSLMCVYLLLRHYSIHYTHIIPNNALYKCSVFYAVRYIKQVKHPPLLAPHPLWQYSTSSLVIFLLSYAGPAARFN